MQSKNYHFQLNLDIAGFSTSLLCAIHCAVFPYLLSLAPLASLQLFANEWVEYSVITAGLILAILSMARGHKKYHTRWSPIVLVVSGFILIGTGHWQTTAWLEVVLTVAGASLVAMAHLVNWRLIKSCQIPHSN